ncbi:hypothetical protein RDI58_024111 [Solanum bulbocastanum]|uniref:Uncharacterized protein n=1 Tax=Solanum bulbocastanum TaxID=147425 RepID=A0AAN8T0F7_SOLBU
MKNLPYSLSIGVDTFGEVGATLSSSSDVGAPTNKDHKIQFVEQLVLDLHNPNLRESTSLELSKVYSSHLEAYLYVSYTFKSFYYLS